MKIVHKEDKRFQAHKVVHIQQKKMAAVTDEFKDFMANLFSTQEIQRQKEHKEFKKEIQDMIKEGIKQEVEKATKPLKESQEKIVKDHANLLQTVEELTKKVVEIEERRRVSQASKASRDFSE